MGYKDLTPGKVGRKTQWAIGNSPIGLLSENVIKIMKNKEKTAFKTFINFSETFRIYSLFIIILMTIFDKRLDQLTRCTGLLVRVYKRKEGYFYNRSSSGLDPNTPWYTE
jgi:hypothetical protein